MKMVDDEEFKEENNRRKMFKLGDTVAFSKNCKSLKGLSEKERVEYYGELGYGQDKLKRFVFLTEMSPQTGHCVLVEIGNGKIHTMRHTDDFYLVDKEDC